MTKCHLMLLCAALLLLGGCKHASQGPSLSEYGERSLAGQAARFEQYAQLLASLSPAEAMVRQEAMLADAEKDETEESGQAAESTAPPPEKKAELEAADCRVERRVVARAGRI